MKEIAAAFPKYIIANRWQFDDSRQATYCRLAPANRAAQLHEVIPPVFLSERQNRVG